MVDSSVMKSVRLILTALFLFLPVLALSEDPVGDLGQRLKAGSARLTYDAKQGYLSSLLKALDIPVSSQTLVFSKTSLQSEGITPASPRAIYFNDDVYAAWVQGASSIEIMSVDSVRGSVFYALSQENDGRPQFEVVTGHICSACHFSQESPKKFVPKLVLSSVIPDEKGNVEGTFPFPTTDQTPLAERWGGWYVTGTHGAQRHLGNVSLKTPMTVTGNLSRVDFSKSLNVIDLSSRFDTSRYPSAHSDIVALMVLGHQVEVHNLFALASGMPDADPREVGERLVQSMLFVDAAPLKEPVRGSSSFAADFSGRGQRDAQGRSLRDFDLKTRLFRYPLSYLIYSKAFDGMPEKVKTYVYGRLVDVLSGKDKSRDFAHLSAPDRAAILEILRSTKSDFPR